MTIDKHTLALISIVGSSLDVLGALYLAYDLLGGEHGPLRTLTRAVTYAVTGYVSSLVAHVGLKVGLAIGVVTAIVGPCTPFIEWTADHLPERRMGVFGIGLIVVGFALQSFQYWVALLDVTIRS